MRRVILALAAILTWRLPHVPDDVAALQSHDLERAVAAAASLGLIAICAYLLVVIVASRRAQHSRRWEVVARRCAPAVLRACITAGLAAGIATASPAGAVTQPPGSMDGPHDLHGLEFPDRPMSPTPPRSEPERPT